MKLFEVLDNSTDWSWTRQNGKNWLANFEIDGKKYAVEFAATKNRLYVVNEDPESLSVTVDVEFSIRKGFRKSFNSSNTGNEFEVFATVEDIVKAYIQKTKPSSISFNAKEPSKIKLYNRLAKRASSMGYKLYKTGKDEQAGNTGWIFVPKATNVAEAKDFTKGQAKHPELSLANMLDKTDWGKKVSTSVKDVIVRGKDGSIYGRRAVIQRNTGK